MGKKTQEERDQDALLRSQIYVNVNKDVAIRVLELRRLLELESVLNASLQLSDSGEVGVNSYRATVAQIAKISEDVQSAMIALISTENMLEPMGNAIQIVRKSLGDPDPIVRAFAEGVETRLCRTYNTLSPNDPMMSSTDVQINQLLQTLQSLRERVETQPLPEGSKDEKNSQFELAAELGKLERKIERVKEDPFANTATLDTAKKTATSGLNSIMRNESFKGVMAKVKDWFVKVGTKIMEIGSKHSGMVQHLLSQHEKIKGQQKQLASNVADIKTAKDEVQSVSKGPGSR